MKVRLHSNDQAAAEATDRTLQALPGMMRGELVRGPEGNIAFDADGLAEVNANDEAALAFALESQGYVASVIG